MPNLPNRRFRNSQKKKKRIGIPDEAVKSEQESSGESPQIERNDYAIQEDGQDGMKAAALEEKKTGRWEDFPDFCKSLEDGPPRDLLSGLKISWRGDEICVKPLTSTLAERLEKKKTVFEKAIRQFCGASSPRIIYEEARSHQELMDEGARNPEVLLCEDIFGSRLLDCREKSGSRD